MTAELNHDCSFIEQSKTAASLAHRSQPRSVLIADSLPGLRLYAAAVVRKISDTLGTIYEAADGQTAVDLALKYSPDLIIMDVAMPGLNGIKAAAHIWSRNPQTKILFWTQYHREVYIRDLGRIVPDVAIHGYVLKNHADDTLIHAITSVWLQDNPYIDPQVRATSRPSRIGGGLTDREFETLQDLALGLTEKAISTRRHISIRGVQCRAAALYTKLLPARNGAATDNAVNDLFNPRVRMLFEAVKRGLIEPESMAAWESDLESWLESEFVGRG